MGFRQADSEGRGGYARLWTIEDKGNYSLGKISTSKKRKDGEGYDTDFQDGFVRFVGGAHEKAKTINVPDKGINIQILSCDVTTNYNQETKKAYINYVIFAFNVSGDSATSTTVHGKTEKKSSAKTSTKTKVKKEEFEDEADDSLPF